MAVKRQATQTRKWLAWAADSAELHRLVEIMDEAAAAPRREEIDEAADAMRARAAGQGEAAEQAAAGAALQVRERWTPHAVAVERELSLRQEGAAMEVLDKLPPVGLERLSLTVSGASTYSAAIAVEFSDEGCALTVQGDDAGWVHGAFGTMESRLRQNVPWWALIRGYIGWSGFALICAIAVFNVLSSQSDEPVGAGSVGAIGFLAGTGLWVILRRWLLPGFEILRPTTTGRAVRVIAAFGAVALAVLSVVLTALFS